MTVTPYSPRVAQQAEQLAAIVAELPWSLPPSAHDLPFFSALMGWERSAGLTGPDRVSQKLCALALAAKPDDPVAFIEHVLRNLPDIRTGRHSVLDARNRACASEAMDVVRDPGRRLMVDPQNIPSSAAPLPTTTSCQDPESVDRLVAYAERAWQRAGELGLARRGPLCAAARNSLTLGVTVALEGLDRHRATGVPNRQQRESLAPSVRVMQAGSGGTLETRLPAVLSEHLPAFACCALTRLLTGWRKDERLGLLVNAAQDRPVHELDPELLKRWARDLEVLDPSSGTHRRALANRRTTAMRHRQELSSAPLPPQLQLRAS